MIRNLKVLGLALVAVLAMSAMVASAASAVPVFEVDEGSTTKIEGTDEGVVELKVTTAGVTCTEVSYTAHATGASVESVTADPSYKGCTGPAGIEARVTGFGDWSEPVSKQCDFVIKASGKADLSCPAGADVTVEAGGCTVHMGSQTNLGTIEFTTGIKDFGGGVKKHDLILHLNIKKIKGDHTDGFLCPMTGSGESESAELTGTITVWARRAADNAPVGITWTP